MNECREIIELNGSKPSIQHALKAIHGLRQYYIDQPGVHRAIKWWSSSPRLTDSRILRWSAGIYHATLHDTFSFPVYSAHHELVEFAYTMIRLTPFELSGAVSKYGWKLSYRPTKGALLRLANDLRERIGLMMIKISQAANARKKMLADRREAYKESLEILDENERSD